MKYDKDTFESMLDDWKADNSEEMEDLEIDEIKEENGAWIAYAHDGKATYSLIDDGTGNIVIYYLGAR